MMIKTDRDRRHVERFSCPNLVELHLWIGLLYRFLRWFWGEIDPLRMWAASGEFLQKTMALIFRLD